MACSVAHWGMKLGTMNRGLALSCGRGDQPRQACKWEPACRPPPRSRLRSPRQQPKNRLHRQGRSADRRNAAADGPALKPRWAQEVARWPRTFRIARHGEPGLTWFPATAWGRWSLGSAPFSLCLICTRLAVAAGLLESRGDRVGRAVCGRIGPAAGHVRWTRHCQCLRAPYAGGRSRATPELCPARLAATSSWASRRSPMFCVHSKQLR